MSSPVISSARILAGGSSAKAGRVQSTKDTSPKRGKNIAKDRIANILSDSVAFRAACGREYYLGTKVGQAFQPDGTGKSGWKARRNRQVWLESLTYVRFSLPG
jgi:hypothetical protein